MATRVLKIAVVVTADDETSIVTYWSNVADFHDITETTYVIDDVTYNGSMIERVPGGFPQNLIVAELPGDLADRINGLYDCPPCPEPKKSDLETWAHDHEKRAHDIALGAMVNYAVANGREIGPAWADATQSILATDGYEAAKAAALAHGSMDAGQAADVAIAKTMAEAAEAMAED